MRRISECLIPHSLMKHGYSGADKRNFSVPFPRILNQVPAEQRGASGSGEFLFRRLPQYVAHELRVLAELHQRP